MCLDAIRRVWPDDHRVELNDTAILVSHRYGGSEPTSLPSRSRYGSHSLRMRSGAIRMNTIVGNTLRCLGFRTRSK